MSRMPWTAADLATLRREFPTSSLRAIAARIGRTFHAVKTRATLLGLRRGRKYFTAAEKAAVAQLYPTHTCEQINTIVFAGARKLSSLYQLVERLDLPQKFPRYSELQIMCFEHLHAEGHTDSEIGRRMRVKRRNVGCLRVRLGLPQNTAAIKAAQRQAVRTQFERLGIRHGGDLHRLGYQRFAIANGWPADTSPRGVQILNVLAARGPMTRHDLAVAIGATAHDDQRKLLSGTARQHGSYTAELLASGLITHIRRNSGVFRKGQLPGLYLLTPAAIDMIQQRARIKEVS